jgi:hypothetical protein
MDQEIIHVQHEVGYEKDGALDYFHTCTDSKYEDEKKYKVVATKYKEVTDEDDIANGYRDWEWCIEVYKVIEPVGKYFSFYVDENDNKDDKLSLTGNGFVAVSEELESLVDVFFPDGEETMVNTDTSNYPDEEITLSDIRLDLMRYLDNRANRGL